MLRVRYRSDEGIHWGRLDGGRIVQLDGPDGPPTGASEMLSDVTLLAPCDPRVIVCVGKNYADHVREMGGGQEGMPTEPGLFLKGLNALSSPGDPILHPAWSNQLHFEGELAVVIGRRMRRISADEALDYVLGYTCALDVTARDKQRTDLQWARAKSSDGFCPVGPWLQTELDPGDVAIETRVNGEVRQSGNTRDMIFNVPAILSFISTFMTLGPGDLVLTGTPEGVGLIRPGDAVEVTIEGIGTLSNQVEWE